MSRPPTMAIGTSSGSRCAIRCGQRAAPSGGGPAHMPSMAVKRQSLGGSGCLGSSWEDCEHLPGHVALQTADGLLLGLALADTARHIVLGLLGMAQPRPHDPVQRRVGLAIPTPIEPKAAGLARGGPDRRGAAT